jgi:hypothetical protein
VWTILGPELPPVIVILTTIATSSPMTHSLVPATAMAEAAAMVLIHATHHNRLRMSGRKKKQGRWFRRYRRHLCSFCSFQDDDDRWRLILRQPWVA